MSAFVQIACGFSRAQASDEDFPYYGFIWNDDATSVVMVLSMTRLLKLLRIWKVPGFI